MNDGPFTPEQSGEPNVPRPETDDEAFQRMMAAGFDVDFTLDIAGAPTDSAGSNLADDADVLHRLVAESDREMTRTEAALRVIRSLQTDYLDPLSDETDEAKILDTIKAVVELADKEWPWIDKPVRVTGPSKVSYAVLGDVDENPDGDPKEDEPDDERDSDAEHDLSYDANRAYAGSGFRDIPLVDYVNESNGFEVLIDTQDDGRTTYRLMHVMAMPEETILDKPGVEVAKCTNWAWSDIDEVDIRPATFQGPGSRELLEARYPLLMASIDEAIGGTDELSSRLQALAGVDLSETAKMPEEDVAELMRDLGTRGVFVEGVPYRFVNATLARWVIDQASDGDGAEQIMAVETRVGPVTVDTTEIGSFVVKAATETGDVSDPDHRPFIGVIVVELVTECGRVTGDKKATVIVLTDDVRAKTMAELQFGD